MADGQQVHCRLDFRIENQVIARKVFAQRICRASRKLSKQSQRFGRSGWLLKVAPAHARESTQVRKNGCAQFGQQVVIGEMCVGACQKFLNGIEPFEEAGGQLDLAEPVSHVAWLIGRQLLT